MPTDPDDRREAGTVESAKAFWKKRIWCEPEENQRAAIRARDRAMRLEGARLAARRILDSETPMKEAVRIFHGGAEIVEGPDDA